ncbi:Holliday junction resolvase RuvX [Candidatus Fermentibacteria bacterium]|nr:Holliday junction resolvase RuvX [Candidatus Fermentibacteria bacterium]
MRYRSDEPESADSDEGDGRAMAVDYGRRHLGIAVSDPLRIIASPLRAVDIENPEHGINVVARLVRELNITDLVVGLPRCMRGEEGAMAMEVREWATRLGAVCGVPLHLVDERLTSAEAARVARSRRRRSRCDDIAAALVLRVFLESLR